MCSQERHKKETTQLNYLIQRDHYNIYRFYSTHKSFIQIGITNSLLDNFMFLSNLDIFMLLSNLDSFMFLSNLGLTNPLFRHYFNYFKVGYLVLKRKKMERGTW